MAITNCHNFSHQQCGGDGGLIGVMSGCRVFAYACTVVTMWGLIKKARMNHILTQMMSPWDYEESPRSQVPAGVEGVGTQPF